MGQLAVLTGEPGSPNGITVGRITCDVRQQTDASVDVLAPGAGWDALMRFGERTIANKVLYGTGLFLINCPHAELVGEMRRLQLAPESARR